jgi:hypothetical protein
MSWYHVWCEIVLHLARLWVGFPGWSTTNMEYCKDFATEPMNDIKQIGSIFFFLLDLWSWTFCHVDISSTMDLELLFLAESKNTCHVLVDNPTIGRSFFRTKSLDDKIVAVSPIHVTVNPNTLVADLRLLCVCLDMHSTYLVPASWIRVSAISWKLKMVLHRIFQRSAHPGENQNSWCPVDQKC